MDKANIKMEKKINLDPEDIKILDQILELYKSFYPFYSIALDKKKYFAKENLVRYEYTDLSYTSLEDDYLGYIICKDGTLCLEDNFIKFMLLRYNGLQKCIKEYEGQVDKKDYLEYLQHELDKIKILFDEYQKKKSIIEISRESKIDFVKRICEAIEWSDSNDISKCSEVLSKNDLHPKTFGEFKQLVLGTIDTNYLLYKLCTTKFMGFVEASIKEVCDKTVEWNIMLNKYSVLSAYYKKALFIRLLLKEGITMPYRRYNSVKESEKKGKRIGTLTFGPFKYSINYDETITSSLNLTGRYNFKKFLFYDKKNFPIIPPLLRSAITITYTEFKDFICYLNLPVFRSTVNRNMLFFPNYDMHQILLAIQGLPSNYFEYTGHSIEWKWFKDGEIVAKEAIDCFCKQFEEHEGYGIEPVQYEWYEIDFKPNKQKHIFRVCSMQEYLKYYREQNYLLKNGKFYLYNDLSIEQVNTLVQQFSFKKPRTFREKYLKYKIKYLNLKKLLQKMNNNI